MALSPTPMSLSPPPPSASPLTTTPPTSTVTHEEEFSAIDFNDGVERASPKMIETDVNIFLIVLRYRNHTKIFRNVEIQIFRLL